jgi:Ca2+-binding RTX toxin-like protein
MAKSVNKGVNDPWANRGSMQVRLREVTMAKINGTKRSDRLYGTEGDDTINGGDGNDFLFGRGGSDNLNGGNGNDDLRGEAGADSLIGGAGDDALHGGAGADTMTGGTGADHFDYTAFSDSAGATVDWITDYNRAQGDDLVFAALDANPNVDGFQQWTYVQQLGEFAGTNGQATLTYDLASKTTTLTLYNNDGHTTADFTVLFSGQYGVGDIKVTVLDMLGGPAMDGIIWG